MRGIIDTIGLAMAGIVGALTNAIAHSGWLGSWGSRGAWRCVRLRRGPPDPRSASGAAGGIRRDARRPADTAPLRMRRVQPWRGLGSPWTGRMVASARTLTAARADPWVVPVIATVSPLSTMDGDALRRLTEVHRCYVVQTR
jgi:hypothetical protein